MVKGDKGETKRRKKTTKEDISPFTSPVLAGRLSRRYTHTYSLLDLLSVLSEHFYFFNLIVVSSKLLELPSVALLPPPCKLPSKLPPPPPPQLALPRGDAPGVVAPPHVWRAGEAGDGRPRCQWTGGHGGVGHCTMVFWRYTQPCTLWAMSFDAPNRSLPNFYQT